MSENRQGNTIISEQVEIYFARNANGVIDALADNPDEIADIYPPAYGLRISKVNQTGIGEFQTETFPIYHFAMTEPGYEDDAFCIHKAVDQLEKIEEWFDKESLYDYDERGDVVFNKYDLDESVTLDSTGGVTIVLDYIENTYNADNQVLRARLYYGGPWNGTDNQHLAFTVYTKHLPESFQEVGEIVEFLFRHEPVQDIPLCIFEDNKSENAYEGTEEHPKSESKTRQ